LHQNLLPKILSFSWELQQALENTGFAVCNIADRGNTGFSAAIDTEEENPDIKTD
jgi:hypothetical protein